MLVERDAWMWPAQQLGERALELLERRRRRPLPSSSITSKAQGTAVRSRHQERSNSKTASSLSPVTIASPSIRKECAGSAATAAKPRNSLECIFEVERIEELPLIVRLLTPTTLRH